MNRLSNETIVAVSVVVFLGAAFYAYGFARTAQKPAADGSALAAVPAVEMEAGAGMQPALTRSGKWSPGRENVNPHFFSSLQSYEVRLRQTPSDTTAMREYAALLHGAHRLSESAMWYERYLTARPSARQARLDLASVYADIPDWKKAQVQMEAMLRNDEADEEAQYNLGAILANQGRLKEARTWWEMVAAQTRNENLQTRARSALASLQNSTGR